MNRTSVNESIHWYIFRIEHHILTWLSALIGIIFSCLSIIRYFRWNHQRTPLTYVYHFSLGFSLLLCLISTPLHTLTSYFWSILPLIDENRRRVLCNFDLIAFFLSSTGIGYSIAYANIERTFFIFHSQNIRLTWMRQFAPFVIIFIFSSLVITLFVLLTPCVLSNYPCFFCYVNSFRLLFVWCFLQFLFPFILMLIAIGFLIYRIEIYTKRIRISINRKRSRKKFQRILIHLNIYSFYYLFSTCPLSIYLLARYNLQVRQSIDEIVLINYSFISLHCYSVLIFFLTQIKQQQQQHRIVFHQEQKQSPYIIVTRPSVQLDEYERTRL